MWGGSSIEVGHLYDFSNTLNVSQLGGKIPLAIHVQGTFRDGDAVTPGVSVSTNLGTIASMYYGHGAMGAYHNWSCDFFIPYTKEQLKQLTTISVSTQAYQKSEITMWVSAWK